MVLSRLSEDLLLSEFLLAVASFGFPPQWCTPGCHNIIIITIIIESPLNVNPLPQKLPNQKRITASKVVLQKTGWIVAAVALKKDH